MQSSGQNKSPAHDFKQLTENENSEHALGQPIANRSLFEASALLATPTKTEPSVDVSDIKGMYKHLFENDLNWTRNRALDELVQFRDKQYYCQQEAEHLRQVQAQLSKPRRLEDSES